MAAPASKVTFEHPSFEIDADGSLRNKETKEPFTEVGSAVEGEQLLACIISYVHSIMKEELGFEELWIPEEDAEARCNIFASTGFSSAKKLLVFVASGRGLAPGIWSRSVVLRHGLKSGSMLPYFKAAQKEHYGVLVLNPNLTHVAVTTADGAIEKVNIPSSSTAEEHMSHVWETYILPSQAEEVSFICFGYGGVLVKNLLGHQSEEMLPRVGGVVFVESSHRSEDSDPELVKKILSEKSVAFESTEDVPLGAKLEGAAPHRTGCTCISAGKPDKRRIGENSNAAYTLEVVTKPVFQFLQTKDLARFVTEIAPQAAPEPSPKRKPSRAPSNERNNAASPTMYTEKQCNICAQSFNLFDRRHHCRMCGRAVCSACSPDRLFLPGSSTAQRVCQECVQDAKPRAVSADVRNTSMYEQEDSRKSKREEKLTVEDFDLLKVVGKGAFGKVMLVRKKDRTGQANIYAMKVLKKQAVFEKNQVEHTKAERRILRDIDHPFIVRLRFAFQSEDKLYLVMDYYPGGSLFFHLRRSRRFSEIRARFYAAELVLALSHLHQLGIAYRDLKLENILMDAEGNVALTDFGLSKEHVDLPNGATTFCGTAEYIAPELLKGQAYGKAVDWWSFGTLVYEMMTGQTPFFDKNRKRMFHNILYRDVQFTPAFSEECQSLLLGLLRRDPQKRLGSASNGSQEIMDHPWFSSIDWERLYEKKVHAPFKPEVKDEMDVSNVANVFTREVPKDSPSTSTLSTTTKAKTHFDGFTYIGESELDRDR